MQSFTEAIMLLLEVYKNIKFRLKTKISGKVSYALSELSGGVADEISLNAVKNNPENFWKALLAYYNQVTKFFQQIIKKKIGLSFGGGVTRKSQRRCSHF